ncbi:hypothetical protein BDV11DRAFT_198523 [Aspergillus similis]
MSHLDYICLRASSTSSDSLLSRLYSGYSGNNDLRSLPDHPTCYLRGLHSEGNIICNRGISDSAPVSTFHLPCHRPLDIPNRHPSNLRHLRQHPQITQDADILATRLVPIPDFFRGDRAKHEWAPPDIDEKTAALMEFVTTKASFAGAAKSLSSLVDTHKGVFPSVQKWGAYGLCWGVKCWRCRLGRGHPLRRQCRFILVGWIRLMRRP